MWKPVDQWQTANIFNLWYDIVTPCLTLEPSDTLTLFCLRRWLSDKPLSPFHIWLPPPIVFYLECTLVHMACVVRPVFVPWKHALNVYIHEFPLICHTLRGLSHYRIIECIHISPLLSAFFFWIWVPAGLFSWNVIYMSLMDVVDTAWRPFDCDPHALLWQQRTQ